MSLPIPSGKGLEETRYVIFGRSDVPRRSQQIRKFIKTMLITETLNESMLLSPCIVNSSTIDMVSVVIMFQRILIVDLEVS